MSEQTSKRVVVVTGASAGVGRATVRAFAREGADLGLLARGRDGLEVARQEVESFGGRAMVLPTDVSDPQQVESAAERVERELGPIDVWVNDAMVTVMSEIKDMTPEEFRRVTEVNYLGTVYGTLSALRRMLPRNRGVIVQVGSALAYRSIPLQSAYCATKAAIRGFTDSLRTELLHQGSDVHVTMVQLPALNTPQFDWSKNRFQRKPQPVPPIFQPEVAANAIVFASGAQRREVWVGARASFLIFANKLAPGIGDRYLARGGYESQLTDEPSDPAAPHNLHEPLPGDWGAHGRFSDRASRRSPQLFLTKHRHWFVLLAGGALTGALSMALGRQLDR